MSLIHLFFDLTERQILVMVGQAPALVKHNCFVVPQHPLQVQILLIAEILVRGLAINTSYNFYKIKKTVIDFVSGV